MYMEGRVSQNFDIGLSFCFIVCRRWQLGRKYKNLKSYPFFVIKLKLRPKQEI